VTVLNAPEDEKNSDTVLDMLHLTASTLKKGPQVMDESVNNFFDIDHFMDRCLKFKRCRLSCYYTRKCVTTRTKKQKNKKLPLSSLGFQSHFSYALYIIWALWQLSARNNKDIPI